MSEPAKMLSDERRARIRDVVSRRQQGAVVLEDVHDPHNLAAVLRSCEAFGFQRAVLIFEDQPTYDPRSKGRNAAASAIKWLDFSIFHSTEEALSTLKAEGYELVATVPAPDAESLFEAQLTAEKIAVLVGNEHLGLTDTALGYADRRVTIPMAGMVESLNLSVTAALTLFELSRQRRERDPERYRLPEAERVALEREFVERGERKRRRR